MSSNEIEKFFNEIPNTAALPVREKEIEPVTYDEAITVVENILKKDPELYKQYKSGNIFNNKVDNGVDILSLIVSCYVNALRNKLVSDSSKTAEEIQKINLTLTTVQTIFNDMLQLLKDLNFNLDASSATAIIYGIIECQLKEHIKK